MGEPRADKVAIVAEVKAKLESADSVLITEYRGLDVPALASLRSAIGEAGGEYRIYKNSLVRFAANELGLELEELLVGPTAIAFVGQSEDGAKGDAAGLAKAVVEFGKSNDALVIKGGILNSEMLSLEQISSLAKIASREELLARFAGGLAAPMQRFASLLQALPRNFAYGLQALINENGAADAPAAPEPASANGADDSGTTEQGSADGADGADDSGTTEQGSADGADGADDSGTTEQGSADGGQDKED
ncbi:MAG: 50S ribosomal protein L10 [Acidobacteria bacterium]|nr:50S ribosomal protein L10 [Acidobacteriota bacterium]